MSLPPLPGRRPPVLGLLLLLLAVPRGASAQDREVVELDFRGNRTFSDGELAQAITTAETQCRSFVFVFPLPLCPLTDWGFAHQREFLDESSLPADLLRLRIFYRRHGYRDVQVDTAVERTDGEARVRFVVEEGPPTLVESLEIRGLEGIVDTAQARGDVPLRPGDPLDLRRLNQGKDRLVERLRNRGYAQATVLSEYFVPSGERRAQVALEVHPGPRMRIGEIRVEGAGALGTDVVREMLTFSSGQHYSQSRLLESQRELFRLEAVRFANVRAEPSAGSDTLVDVTVEVTPAPFRSVRTGVGVTTTDCVETQARFTHRNFLGQARRLQFTGEVSNLLARELAGTFPCTSVGEADVFQDLNFALRADFRQPFFLSGRNTLEAGLFLERETVPDIFVRESRGGELSLTKRLRTRMPLTLTYRPELTRFDERSADVFFCVNFGFCQPEDITALTRDRWLSSVALTWSYDRTNAPFSPTSGYYVSTSLEGAEAFTGSDYEYLRFNVEAADFEQLAPGLVLAVRFRAGLVEALGGEPFGAAEEAVIHPRKRFFAGGAQSVRGFGQNLLGPTVLLLNAGDCSRFGVTGTTRPDLARCARAIAASGRPPQDFFDERPVGGDAAFEANFELRARLGSRWSLVGFVDMGQVWVDVGELEVPVVTPGAGIRYSSPVGPLRLDVGYDPTPPDRLPVVAEVGEREILELDEFVVYDPFAYDDPGPFTEFYRRLKVHISIGEAF